MLTLITFALILSIIVLGAQLLKPQPKLQPIKIKPQQQNNTPQRRRHY